MTSTTPDEWPAEEAPEEQVPETSSVDEEPTPLEPGPDDEVGWVDTGDTPAES